MIEEYEKQFAVSAEVQANSGRPSGKQAKKGVHSSGGHGSSQLRVDMTMPREQDKPVNRTESSPREQ